MFWRGFGPSFLYYKYHCRPKVYHDKFTHKEKQMKKSVVLVSLAIAAVSIATASATFVTSNSKQAELERASRMENLSVVAVKNGNYELACKAQTQVVDALTKGRVRGEDLVGSAIAQKEDLCRKAAVSAMNEHRFLAG
jgi:hypothetical protein